VHDEMLFKKLSLGKWMGVPARISDEILARYARGKSTAAERDTVEAAYLSNESVHQRLMTLEEELFDEYVRGHLNSEERERFEALHLCSQRDLDRLAFSRALCRVVDERHARTALQTEAAGSEDFTKSDAASGTAWLFRLFSRQPSFFRFALPTALAAVLIAAIIVPLRTHHLESRVPAAKPAANGETPNPPRAAIPTEITPKQAAQSHEVPPVFAFSLVPSTRDASRGSNTIRVPRAPTTIRLKIALASIDFPQYRASLENQNGGPKFSIPAHRLERRSTTVYVDIASDQLNTGDYLLELWGLAPDHAAEEIEGYAFSVERGR